MGVGEQHLRPVPLTELEESKRPAIVTSQWFHSTSPWTSAPSQVPEAVKVPSSLMPIVLSPKSSPPVRLSPPLHCSGRSLILIPVTVRLDVTVRNTKLPFCV